MDASGPRVGIGILAYYSLPDVQRAVAGVREHTRLPYDLLIFDNSENFEVGEWARDHATDAVYIRSPYNVGCAVARNRMSEWFARHGHTHFVIMDQDVEPVKGEWAADMLRVFAEHPDTGVVGWQLAIRQMSPDYKPDKTGAVTELPGMCNMYSLACVAAAGGWCERMVMFRFDTLFCQRAGKAGFKTRVVMPDTNKIRHNHPHNGIKRNPRWREEQARSRKIYREECEKHGLKVLFG